MTYASRRIDFWPDESLMSRIIQSAVEVLIQRYGIFTNTQEQLMAMPLIVDFIWYNKEPSYGAISKSEKII